MVGFLRPSFGGLRKPKQKIPGFDFAGEIVFVGREVTGWKVGDLIPPTPLKLKNQISAKN